MSHEQIKIKLKSFSYDLLDDAALNIGSIAKRTGATINGPIPLPVKKEKFIVIRSPHVFKKSREQFKRSTHSRLIIINYPTPQTIDSLMKLDLPAGVDVEIKVGEE